MLTKIKHNPQLFTIFLIVFIDLLGFGIILPLLPFIGEKYGATPVQIGFLAATYSFFQLIATPILGRLSDRFGRKKMLIISQAGSAIGYLLLGFANSLPLLFLSRAIDGATGGNISIAQAYIADVTTKENRAKGMGLIGAAFGLGFIFGPAVGGLLSYFGFWAPALLATILSIITIIATSVFLTETVNVTEAKQSSRTAFSLAELRKTFAIDSLRTMIIVFFILNLAFSGLQGVFPIWASDKFGLSPTEIGLLFTFIGIMAVLVQLRILPKALKRFPEARLLKIALVSMTVGLLLLIAVFNPWLIFIPLFFMSLGNGLANPVIQSLASESVPKEDFGGALGLLQSAGSFGRIGGPIIGAELYQHVGMNFPFLISALMVFFTLGIVFHKNKQ
jgi:DHA1 family tetracycline resistance protein-like MFS transporter